MLLAGLRSEGVIFDSTQRRHADWRCFIKYPGHVYLFGWGCFHVLLLLLNMELLWLSRVLLLSMLNGILFCVILS